MYEERLVAFLDILGFKEAVNESSASQERFDEIYRFLQLFSSSNHAKEIFSGFRNGDGEPCKDADISRLSNIYSYTFTQFSDSFVFSTKKDDVAGSQFLPYMVAQFTTRAFDLGFLVRGGVSIGKMVHERAGPAFGPAFIEAYHIENQQASFGRTVVSKEAFAFLKDAGRYCTDFIEDGYDGEKEITIASFINKVNRNKPDRVSELENAISRLRELKEKIPQRDRDSCDPKYDYVQDKLRDAIAAK